MTTRTLVVWCPDWPVTAAGHRPDEPVVVVDHTGVVACSAAARASGVRRALRRREAQARCPEAEVIEHDPGRDARAFEPVAAAVETFTPAVEVLRPGVCAVASRGPSRYFGGDDALAARVTAIVAGLVPDVRVGIADGVFAAVLAARRARVIAPGGSPAFLAPFPVSALESHDLADLLRRLGIRTLGDLAALPPASVLARFGPEGARAHRLASGFDERPPAPRVPPVDLAVTAHLDPPVERVDAAAFTGKALADELTARLGDLGLTCTRVCIEAETEHGEHLARLWRHDGSLTAAAMADRVRWQLDGWLAGTSTDQPSGGLTLLRLTPDEVHPDDGCQSGFWGGGVAGERVARALARVQGLLGPDAVTTAVVAGGRSPAEQVRLIPWGDPRPSTSRVWPVEGVVLQAPRSGDGVAPWPGALPPPSPATVHVPALRAEVVDVTGAPVGVTGRGVATAEPARLSVDGGPWAAVDAWAGPWPVEERWWDTTAHRRRARWQVTTSDGAAHLLAVEAGRWLVEATYD